MLGLDGNHGKAASNCQRVRQTRLTGMTTHLRSGIENAYNFPLPGHASTTDGPGIRIPITPAEGIEHLESMICHERTPRFFTGSTHNLPSWTV